MLLIYKLHKYTVSHGTVKTMHCRGGSRNKGKGGHTVAVATSVSGRGGLVSWPMESRGNCMLLSAETECSSGALRFGAGEKKLVIFDEAGCLRFVVAILGFRVRISARLRACAPGWYTRERRHLAIFGSKGGARAPCVPP